ncbi:baculoviral IAP repeat-containing protein 3-like [Aphis gossypii]|uniref:baculoviral IAP repeat-containing protein 3-like n=1 Tax=Aphis gossypii TaxID=80765 RepID=UPI0021594658|nr:baculoviral IAP repeat-containing protein 3-like [Aphis gossypii]XP_050066131.1 baculoviral IAP repeat-containing protein 3-like [Aphis gossypii]
MIHVLNTGVIEDNEDEIAVRVEDHQPELPENIEVPENRGSWDERDFFIPEDLELVRWQKEYGNDEYPDNIPYVQIDRNLQVNLHNEETICVVCRDGARSHASVPCGHRVLCVDCADQLCNNRCPICNGESTGVIRIWQ